MRIEMSHMTPAFQDHSAIERLSFCSYHDAVVLAPCTGVRFAPVKFESLEFQRIERDEQVRRPLVTVTAFPEAVIDEKIVKNWRAKHVVLAPELTHSRVSTICQQPCFVLIHSG